jgi:murein L,D-transpeptidase YcbB/YkuD
MLKTSTGRSAYDCMLTAVAATFLVVSTGAALAQSTPKSPADLAIDAAVPMPEPANVPPPTAADVKAEPGKAPDAKPTGSIASDAKTEPKAADIKPADAKPADAKPAETATRPAEAAKASTVAAADQPVADRLRDLLATKSSRFFDRKGERAAVETFYKNRDYAPVLTEAGAANARAKAAIARLKDAGSDGLDPADYPTPDFAAATSPDAAAEAELKLLASMLDYARQAQSGRMHWSRVSADIAYPEHPVDAAEVLTNLSTAKDVAAALNSYNPSHKGYLALRAKLAELRGKTELTAPIADGPALKYVPARKKQAAQVMDDSRVPALRARLGLPEAADTQYDEKLAAAVRKFQDGADIKVTGVLDSATVKALNTPKKDRQIDIVRVNMERWRWLPRELGAASLGNAYVILNIPDFTLKVMQHGAQVWTTRVVTGKPGKHATPLLTETMKYITVNPTWNVPPSIIQNEYLPALQQDPEALSRIGLKLERNRDGTIHVWQPPGEGNALGRIRFNFPNKFLVYQHDTPDKHLFAKEERAFSHGCMRVQYPDQYAATLLNIALPNEKYTAERIRGMYGRSEVDIRFPTPIPVNITYQTAFVDDAGKLEFRKDIYGRDAAMLAILRGSEGKDLEQAVAHAQPSYQRPKGDLPQGVAMNGPGGGGGMNFFERLFGGGQSAPPAPVPQRRVYTR